VGIEWDMNGIYWGDYWDFMNLSLKNGEVDGILAVFLQIYNMLSIKRCRENCFSAFLLLCLSASLLLTAVLLLFLSVVLLRTIGRTQFNHTFLPLFWGLTPQLTNWVDIRM